MLTELHIFQRCKQTIFQDYDEDYNHTCQDKNCLAKYK